MFYELCCSLVSIGPMALWRCGSQILWPCSAPLPTGDLPGVSLRYVCPSGQFWNFRFLFSGVSIGERPIRQSGKIPARSSQPVSPGVKEVPLADYPHTNPKSPLAFTPKPSWVRPRVRVTELVCRISLTPLCQVQGGEVILDKSASNQNKQRILISPSSWPRLL